MRFRRLVLALLAGIMALLALNTILAEETTNVVREKDPLEGMVVAPDGVQDGPDGFPTLKKDVKPPRPLPWSTRSTTRSGTTSEEPGELEEIILEIPKADVVCDEASPFACYSSLTECAKKQASDCSTRYPLPPGAVATTLARVTKYDEGRLCGYTCVDRHGELHYVECTPPPPKPQPNPGDVAFPPSTP